MAVSRITWSTFFRLAAVAGATMIAGAAAVDFNASPAQPRPKGVKVSFSQPPPAVFDAMQSRPLTVHDAEAINASIPLEDVGQPAQPFFVPVNSEAYGGATECLTRAIYYEAASESNDGKRAVAQVVLNRVRHPAFPNSICDVVNQGSGRATGCQFSFMCDGSLARRPQISLWIRSRQIAVAALNGAVYPAVGMATHYHTEWVLPYWASGVTKIATVGAHIFYRWRGGWGTPRSFTQRYAGIENDQETAATPGSFLLHPVSVTIASAPDAGTPKSKGITPPKSPLRDRLVLVADSTSSGLKADFQKNLVLLADVEVSPVRHRNFQEQR